MSIKKFKEYSESLFDVFKKKEKEGPYIPKEWKADKDKKKHCVCTDCDTECECTDKKCKKCGSDNVVNKVDGRHVKLHSGPSKKVITPVPPSFKNRKK